MVARNFIGPCPSGKEVNHKDLDKTHNYDRNLEYKTKSGNMQHASKNGMLRHDGERNSNVKLSATEVKYIRRHYKGTKQSRKNLKFRFNVSEACIQDILYNRSWKEIK